MKLFILMLAIAGGFFFYLPATAQTPKRYVVKAGEAPVDALPNEAIYVLPVFTDGVAYMRDGSLSRQKFNYNFVLDEMQFIGENGDTLTIAYPDLIRSVVVDTTVFYHDKTYLQQIFTTDSFKLAVKQLLVQLPDKTRAGYDMASGTSAITTYSSINSNSSIYRLQLKKDVTFEKVTHYYIGDPFDHFVKADKKAFLNMFTIKKESLSKYLKDTNPNYYSKEDLVKLLKYCTQ